MNFQIVFTAVCLLFSSQILGVAVLQSQIVLSKDRISGFKISPSIPFMASYGNAKGEICVFNLLTGKPKSKHPLFKPLKGHQKQSTIYTSAYSDDDQFLAVGRSTEAEIHLLKIGTGSHTVLVDEVSSIKGFGGIRFSKDGSLVIASLWRERAVAIWDAQSGKEIARVKEKISSGSLFLPSIPLAFTVIDGSDLIVEVNPRGTKLWNYKSKQLKELFSAPRLDPFGDRTLIAAAAVSGDGQMSLLLLREAVSNSKVVYHLAIQNNLTGKLVYQTNIDIPGGYFVALELNSEDLIATGFVAGKFLIWKPSDETLTVHGTTEKWLDDNFGWPDRIPFESYIANQLSHGFSIIGEGVVGRWKFQ